MAKSESKTKPTAVTPDSFIDAVADERQREDARAISAMMERLSGEPATMWGPSIIGFGSYHYVYDSGREGDSCRIGFSPRKGQTVLYLNLGAADNEANLSRLGKHKRGKGCLYIKRLSDVDGQVLEELVQEAIDHMDEKYPKGN